MDTFGLDGHPAQATPRRLTVPLGVFALAGSIVFGVGCRSEMYDQPRYKPFKASDFFSDGTSARPIVAGTVTAVPLAGRQPTTESQVARLTDPEHFEHFHNGKVGGDLATTFPFEIRQKDLLRGQDRYMIYCYPCHGATGDGRGMIVQRGFPAPPPFYGKRPSADTSQAQIVYDDLRKAPVGHFFDVMTNGRGVMYSYESRIAPEDRWRIAAYIRALQLSQYAPTSELDEADLEKINQASTGESALLREARR